MINLAKNQAKKKVIWWILGGSLGSLLPFFGIGALLFLVIAAALMVFGGLAFHDQKTPPPLPNQAVYSTQWLSLVQQQGTVEPVPPALIIAAIAASSGGLSLDQTKAGGYGLFDLPNKGDMGHPTASLTAFTKDLSAHWQSNNLQATLNAVGQTLQPPQSNWSSKVQHDVNDLEEGPSLVAWPVTNNWSKTGLLGLGGTQWDYPKTGRLNIAATATAPGGTTYSVALTPPVRQCSSTTVVHGKTTVHCHVVTNDLTGSDLIAPQSMVVKTSSGKTVSMKEETSKTPHAGALIDPHDTLWVTTRPVLVNAKHKITITATWGGPGGSVSATLPGSGFGQSQSGPLGGGGGGTPVPGSPSMPLLTNPQAIHQWWPSILVASHDTGVSPDLIGSIMLHESEGNPDAFNPLGPAYGLMQILNTTAPGLPAYRPGWEFNGPLNLIMGAQVLEGDYQATGGISWHEAIAAYYGGLGTMEDKYGFRVGMPWSVAAPLLNVIPGQSSGNSETMTAYADQMFAEMAVVASEAPKG